LFIGRLPQAEGFLRPNVLPNADTRAYYRVMALSR
jgi:hypothetical protein